MTNNPPVTRKSIVQALTADLEPRAFVHAFYEGGAAAFNRVDEWSDLDLYVIVDDAEVSDTFDAVEKVLGGLSRIRIGHEVTWPAASGIHQRFYRLDETNEFLLVDLAVLTVSAPDKFLVREIHGDVVVFFDKDGTVRPTPLDTEHFVRSVLDRRRRLRERMELFGPFVQKEIYRGNWLEALDFYRGLVLQSLVEALRMRYGPRRYDFRMRYVHRELPEDVVRRLEHLAFVADANDLAAKYAEAVAWFREAIDQVDETQVWQRVAER